MSYAQHTDVPADRSRSEIERVLQRYGATQFMYATAHEAAVVAFIIIVGRDDEGEAIVRQVRFTIPMPDRNAPEFVWTPAKRRKRTPTQMLAEYERATRRVWRALLLVIKAKLEAVESGISEFEQEFMAHIVMPDGRTVGEWIRPEIQHAYETGKMPPLALPKGSE